MLVCLNSENERYGEAIFAAEINAYANNEELGAGQQRQMLICQNANYVKMH